MIRTRRSVRASVNAANGRYDELRTKGMNSWLAGQLAADGHAQVAAAMSERDLEDQVRSMLKGLPGILDWTFASIHGVMYRELKRMGQKATRAQQQWIDVLRASGQDADVWWPTDLLSGRIARELAALAGMGGTR